MIFSDRRSLWRVGWSHRVNRQKRRWFPSGEALQGREERALGNFPERRTSFTEFHNIYFDNGPPSVGKRRWL